MPGLHGAPPVAGRGKCLGETETRFGHLGCVQRGGDYRFKDSEMLNRSKGSTEALHVLLLSLIQGVLCRQEENIVAYGLIGMIKRH